MQIFDDTVLRVLEHGCEQTLEKIKNKYLPTPIGSLTAIGDDCSIDDVAFAAAAPDVEIASPELSEAWKVLKGGLVLVLRRVVFALLACR